MSDCQFECWEQHLRVKWSLYKLVPEIVTYDSGEIPRVDIASLAPCSRILVQVVADGSPTHATDVYLDNITPADSNFPAWVLPRGASALFMTIAISTTAQTPPSVGRQVCIIIVVCNGAQPWPTSSDVAFHTLELAECSKVHCNDMSFSSTKVATYRQSNNHHCDRTKHP